MERCPSGRTGWSLRNEGPAFFDPIAANSIARFHLRRVSRMLNPSSGSDVPVALEPDPQGGDGAADIGLRFGGLYAEGALHAAHAPVGFVEYRTPGGGYREHAEHAFIKEIVGAVGLAAEGRPVSAG